jgi:predicted nucleic acid-binding protein
LDDLLLPATAIARELGVAVYDALYLALAEARTDELVTWDKRLLRRVQDTRFERIAKPLHISWKP